MENEQLIIQLNSLQEKLEDNKDKEIIRNLKKENDELKTRFNLNLIYTEIYF